MFFIQQNLLFEEKPVILHMNNSNAWESLFERFQKEYLKFGKIRIEFYYTLGLFNEDSETKISILDKIVFIDNGMGIDSQSYNRLLTLRDNSKSARNKSSI